MRLLKLKISNFGMFHNKTIDLSNGINLIYGKNESGKSTIHGFIKGMLFGIEKTRGRPSINDMYDKYEPWDRPGSYDGNITFESNNEIYHLYRSFNKNNKEDVLTQVETGRQMDISDNEFQELIGGLTKSGFDGTISIEQVKAKTQKELIYIVQNHITNLTTSKSLEIDVKKALDNLGERLKEHDTKALRLQIEALDMEIKEGERTSLQVEELIKQITQIQMQIQELNNEKTLLVNNQFYSQDELQGYFMKFPVIKTKYGYYLESLDRSDQLKDKIISLKNQVHKKSPLLTEEVSNIQVSLKELESLSQRHSNLVNEKAEYKISQEDELELSRRRNLYVSSPMFVAGLILFLLNYPANDNLFKLGVSIAIIGIIVFVTLNMITGIKKKSFQTEFYILEDNARVIEDQIVNMLNKYKTQSISDLRKIYENSLRDHQIINQLEKEIQAYESEYSLLQEKIERLQREIIEYVNLFIYIYPDDIQKDLVLNDDVIGVLDEYITDESLKLNKYRQDVKPQLIELLDKKEKIRWKIDLLESKEELSEDQDKYQELLEKERNYEIEKKSINLASSVIRELSADIHDTFGTRLNEEVSNKVSEITKGRYKDVKVNEKLKIKTEIGDKYRRLERLSVGTIDQIYLSLRLSLADMIYGKNQVPILLDDTFAYYDDSRLRYTLELLSREKDRQIIIFTCHKREKEILDDLGVSYTYTEL